MQEVEGKRIPTEGKIKFPENGDWTTVQTKRIRSQQVVLDLENEQVRRAFCGVLGEK